MAYKALKAARGARGGRDTARMMAKMGVKMDELPGVTQVIIRTSNNKDIVIDAPSVTMVTVQGQAMYQIAGGEVSESQSQTVSASNAPLEADVQLVAQQTGKSVDESRKALTESGGDLARAILILKGQQN